MKENFYSMDSCEFLSFLIRERFSIVDLDIGNYSFFDFVWLGENGFYGVAYNDVNFQLFRFSFNYFEFVGPSFLSIEKDAIYNDIDDYSIFFYKLCEHIFDFQKEDEGFFRYFSLTFSYSYYFDKFQMSFHYDCVTRAFVFCHCKINSDFYNFSPLVLC